VRERGGGGGMGTPLVADADAPGLGRGTGNEGRGTRASGIPSMPARLESARGPGPFARALAARPVKGRQRASARVGHLSLAATAMPGGEPRPH
jgi:hypothetical protein